MKTRTVWTQIWEDDWFQSLSDQAQRLFLFLITNKNIGFTGYYQVSDWTLKSQARIKDLERTKRELFPKVKFHKDWVYVVNAEYYNTFRGSGDRAREKELSKIPAEIINALNTKVSYQGLGEGLPGVNPLTNTNTNSFNNTRETVKTKKKQYSLLEEITDVEISSVAQKYEVSPRIVKRVYEELVDYCEGKGKKYDNYLAALRSWVRRRIDEKPEIVGLKKLSNIQLNAIKSGNLSIRLMEEDGYDTSIFRTS